MNFHEQPVFAVIITGCGKSCVKRGDAQCDPGDPGWPQVNYWISNFLVFVGNCFISTKHSSFSALKWKKNLKKRIERFNVTNLWRKKKTPLAIIPIRTAAEFSSGSLSSTQFTSAINQWMTSAPGFHPGEGRWSQYPTQSSAESRIWVCPSRGAGSAAWRLRPCPSDF